MTDHSTIINAMNNLMEQIEQYIYKHHMTRHDNCGYFTKCYGHSPALMYADNRIHVEVYIGCDYCNYNLTKTFEATFTK